MRLNRLSILTAIVLSAFAMPAMAAKSATVKGVVHDADGQPAARAEVRLLHREKGAKKLKMIDTETTNRRGEFSFEDVDDGTYVVVAVANEGKLRDRTEITVHDNRDPAALAFNVRPGRAAAREAAEEDEAEKSPRKKSYVNFVGQVVDEDGKPVKDAVVRLLTGDNDANTDKLEEVQKIESENKGRFEFYKVRNGNYVVEARKGKQKATKVVKLNDTDGTESIQLKLK
jgi:hypothetical protein